MAFCVLEIGELWFDYLSLESNPDGVAEQQVSLPHKTKGC